MIRGIASHANDPVVIVYECFLNQMRSINQSQQLANTAAGISVVFIGGIALLSSFLLFPLVKLVLSQLLVRSQARHACPV